MRKKGKYACHYYPFHNESDQSHGDQTLRVGNGSSVGFVNAWNMKYGLHKHLGVFACDEPKTRSDSPRVLAARWHLECRWGLAGPESGERERNNQTRSGRLWLPWRPGRLGSRLTPSPLSPLLPFCPDSPCSPCGERGRWMIHRSTNTLQHTHTH